jgi:hypothetical protein
MRYADCPTTTVSTSISASAGVVWSLASDISLSSRFSPEASRAEWLDGTSAPSLGARFTGHSAHQAIGEWTTTCVISAFEPEQLFEWSVTGPNGDVSSIWRFTITPIAAGGVELVYWYQMGPGRSGLNAAIDAMPEKEAKIVARRLDEHRVNMLAVIAGVKELAEADAQPEPR